MPTVTITMVLQLIIGVGLLNVWVLRRGNATSYRGGAARTLREEFTAYGLPATMFYLVGTLKVVAGLVLLAGLWWPLPMPVKAAAGVVAALMLGAIVMHVKVKDPAVKYVPAALVFVMCVALIALTW